MAPTTTLATPASMRASTQGGVRPWNVQGSRVTITVPPRAAGPAAVQRHRLGMGMPGTDVGALADDLSVRVEDDGPDSGIGVGAMDRCQFERPAHVGDVVLTTQALT